MKDKDHGHPTASRSKAFSGDQRLRRRGWQIHSRPGDGEAWWWLPPDGKSIRESEVWRIIEKEEAEAETEGR